MSDGINSGMLVSMDQHSANPKFSSAITGGSSGIGSSITGSNPTLIDEVLSNGIMNESVVGKGAGSGVNDIFKKLESAFERNPFENILGPMLEPGKIGSGNELNNQNPVGKGFDLEHLTAGGQVNAPPAIGLNASETSRTSGG